MRPSSTSFVPHSCQRLKLSHNQARRLSASSSRVQPSRPKHYGRQRTQFHIPRTSYAQTPEETTPNGRRKRGRTKLYETGRYRLCKLIPSPSNETAVHRCDKGVARYRERVRRCFPTSQIVFGRNQCARQILRSASPSNRPRSH